MRYEVPSCYIIFFLVILLWWILLFLSYVAEVIFFYTMVLQLAIAKDPDAAFFRRLEGLQPCEVSELKAGTHIFAVYGWNYFVSFEYGLAVLQNLYRSDIHWILSGDNFFKTASYTIEALCSKTYEDTTEKLKDVEGQILRKRNELRQFETEYRKVESASIDVPSITICWCPHVLEIHLRCFVGFGTLPGSNQQIQPWKAICMLWNLDVSCQMVFFYMFAISAF